MSQKIELLLSDDLISSLEYCKKESKASSLNHVIEEALNLYIWVKEEQARGYKLYLEKESFSKTITKRLLRFRK